MPEPIRRWYQRTTAIARRWLVTATAVSVPGGIWFFLAVPLPVTAHLQTFNGAITIPISAAIWVGAFIFLFLIPSREGSFRSVESVERTEVMVREAIDSRIPKVWDRDVKPVLALWEEIGKKVLTRLNEESFERILDGLEKLVAVPPADGKGPDPSAAFRAFRQARKIQEEAKKETRT